MTSEMQCQHGPFDTNTSQLHRRNPIPHDVLSMPLFQLGIDIFEHRSTTSGCRLLQQISHCEETVESDVRSLVSSRQFFQNIGFQQQCTQIKELNLHSSSSEHSLFSTQAQGTFSRMVSLKPWSKRQRTSWKRQKSQVLMQILQCWSTDPHQSDRVS